MSKPDICKTRKEAEDILEELLQHIFDYNTYYKCLEEIDYLTENHLRAMTMSGAFLAAAQKSFYFCILTNLYRIYDVDGESIGIRRVLNGIRCYINSYEEMSEERKTYALNMVNNLRSKIELLDTIICRLKDLRDRRLAHFDKNYFLEGVKLDNEVNITWHDLKKLMDFAGEVCNSLLIEITDGRGWLLDDPLVDNFRRIYSAVDNYYAIPIIDRSSYKHNKEQPT